MVNDPESLLLQELLDTICERFKNIPSTDDCFAMEMSCSRHPDHHEVEREGFLLLELAEGMMGTSLQQIWSIDDESLEDHSDEAFELALSARLARQTEQLDRVGLFEAVIQSNHGLNATILKKTQDWGMEVITIGDFGEDGQGWSWFAKGMQQSRTKRVHRINVSKQVIMKAKKEDLKTVWDATSEDGEWDTVTGDLGLWRRGLGGLRDPRLKAQGVQGTEDWATLERDCSGSCGDHYFWSSQLGNLTSGDLTVTQVCRYSTDQTDETDQNMGQNTDQTDENGKIVDCGFERLEEIWGAGQK